MSDELYKNNEQKQNDIIPESNNYDDNIANSSNNNYVNNNSMNENSMNENNVSENCINENSINEINRNENNIGDQSVQTTPYSFWAEQIAASKRTHDESFLRENSMEENHTTYNYFQNSDENKDTANQSIPSTNQTNFFDMADDKPEEKKRKPRLFGRFIRAAAFAVIFGAIGGASFIGFNAIYYKINPDATPFTIKIGDDYEIFNGYRLNLSPPRDAGKKISATTVTGDVIQQKTDITDVVDATMPSIVTITTTYTQAYDWFGQQYADEQQGGGSGFIVGKNDKELLIATNNHVVEGANPITVTFIDNTQAQAIIKGTDADADLAVVSIDISTISKETLETIKIANLGDSEAVEVGQMAIAIGNALGYGQSTTVGYISAKDREVTIDESKKMVLLQTDAAINPGNSGGALLNIKGEVIGINTVKYASSEVEGMGFAIPISRAMPIINELMNREILTDDEKGYLGVYYEDVTEDIATMYNWPVGVYVKSLAEESSAGKAGIVKGDIITKVNDTEITAGTQLREKVTSYRAGTEITITVMRSVNGEFVEKQIPVTLGKNPELNKN
jgi:serine protease Do